MKLRITSGGYGQNTRVETPGGEEIKGITKIEWSVDAGGVAFARLTVRDVDVAIDAVEIELKKAP